MAVVMQHVLVVYLFFINFVALATMGIDKRKAKKAKWRIPEKTLFVQAFLGGSVGALIGMYCFRHKTKHRKFVVGMPVILVVQLGIAMMVAYIRMS